jgi:hypothetical protein
MTSGLATKSPGARSGAFSQPERSTIFSENGFLPDCSHRGRRASLSGHLSAAELLSELRKSDFRGSAPHLEFGSGRREHTTAAAPPRDAMFARLHSITSSAATTMFAVLRGRALSRLEIDDQLEFGPLDWQVAAFSPLRVDPA